MADSLIFDGFDDAVSVSPGQIIGTGALTYAAVVKIADQTYWNTMVHYNALSGFGFQVRADTQKMAYALGAAFSDSSFTVLSSDGWVLLAYTKPAGSAVGTHHKYVFGTGVWTHGAGNTALASPAAPTVIHLGNNPTDGDFFNGTQLLTAIWDRELADLEVEALSPGLKAWIQAGPKEAWRFDTMSPLRSQITTSAQTARTGTTLNPGDVPAGWTDSLNPGATPPAQANAFPFMARGDRLVEGVGSVLGNRAAGGPRPAGGFERFIYPRLHPIAGSTLTADIADSATPDDAVALTVTLALSDSTTLADAATRTTTKALADSATPADAATRTTTKSLSDSAAPADAATRSVTKALADSAALTDSSAEGASLVTSDSAAPTDAATRTTTKALSDSVAPTDAAARTVTLSLADSAALSDSSAEGTALVTSDTAGVADASTRTVTKALADSATPSDASTRDVALSLADSAALTDSAAEGASLVTSDTAAVSDASTASVALAKADTVTPTDAAAATVSAALADAATLADAAARTVAHAEGDTVTATDDATFAIVLLLEVSDSVTVTDSSADGAQMVTSDTATPSDAVTLTLTKALSDSVTPADARTTSVTLALSDATTLSDNASAGIVTPLDLADSLTLADNLTATVTPAGPDCSSVPVALVQHLRLDLGDALRVRDRFLPGPLVEDQEAADDEFARLWLLELV